MMKNDPYGINKYKEKKAQAEQREINNERMMQDVVSELKNIGSSLLSNDDKK